MPTSLYVAVDRALAIAIMLRVLLPLSRATHAILKDIAVYFGYPSESFNDATTGSFSYLSGCVRVVLWVIGVIACCERMGFDTKAAVTGMGIVSVAAGLALQTTLKNMLGTWAIMTDKVSNIVPCHVILLSSLSNLSPSSPLPPNTCFVVTAF